MNHPKKRLQVRMDVYLQDGSKQFCYSMEFFHFSYLNRWKGHPNGNDDFMFDMLRHIQPMSWLLRTACEKRSLLRLTRTIPS